MVWLPLLGRFRTFCWGEIIEELPNIYKLKELINVPISAINNAWLVIFYIFINKYTPHSHSNHTLSFGVDLTILLIQEHRVVRILCIQSLSFFYIIKITFKVYNIFPGYPFLIWKFPTFPSSVATHIQGKPARQLLLKILKLPSKSLWLLICNILLRQQNLTRKMLLHYMK